jgi:hypothetical protein
MTCLTKRSGTSGSITERSTPPSGFDNVKSIGLFVWNRFDLTSQHRYICAEVRDRVHLAINCIGVLLV